MTLHLGHCYQPWLCSNSQHKSNAFPVTYGLRQACTLSPVLFVIFVDGISRHSRGEEGVQFGHL
uniref:Reverse transcriptase domain-containing protein n=1 Tax=Stegastes partitus TaxID=144197 RepID=A0A3B4Z9A3_9TELE